jgi:hypothetical protein
MTRGVAAAIVKAFRRVALPLAWYYAVTLAIPLANGAAQAGAVFVEHALIVLLVPPLLVALVGATGQLVRISVPRSGAEGTACERREG